ncbi:MAG: hypothetical protein MMC23_001422 [Stictis urceolatum]|nr:hypothetical protein [Stictis urceolata]
MGAPIPVNPAKDSSSAAAVPATTPEDPTIQVDAEEYENDSAYDSEVASYTTSLASSVTDYQFENGRRYHRYQEGRYFWPNDELENDRLDIVHKMVEVAMKGKLFYAPLENPKRVLDIGTGTGIWAMEFADHFPQASVLGNDLSPIQPRWVPPNVVFEVDDVEQDWTYTQLFDFIHARSMAAAIKNWPRLMEQCYQHTAPGGYAEFVDFDANWETPDNSIEKGGAIDVVVPKFIELGEMAGIEACAGPKLEGWCKDAGFVNIKVARQPIPCGTWARDRHLKEIGAWQYMQVVEGLEGMMMGAFTRLYGMTAEEVTALAAKFKAELKNPRVHTFLNMYVVTAQKAAVAEDED